MGAYLIFETWKQKSNINCEMINFFKKGFFGWDSFKWNFIEFKKMYSGRVDSFYSKKRIESGIAFIVLQWGMIYWLLNKYLVMTTTDFLLWAGIEAAVAGYMINQIEKNNKPDEKTTTITDNN